MAIKRGKKRNPKSKSSKLRKAKNSPKKKSKKPIRKKSSVSKKRLKSKSKKKIKKSKQKQKPSVSKKRKYYISRHAQKKFEDPLEVPMPPRWLSSERSKKIVSLRRLQYRLWGWCVALAIALLLLVTAFELLSDFGFISQPSELHRAAMKNGDVLAIFIIGLELVHGFTRAKNKALYLKQNWVAILAILPLGVILRISRAFEGLVILEDLTSLRTLQAAGKFGELRSVVPVLEMPYELEILIVEPIAARLAPVTRGVASVFFAMGPVFDDILEDILSIFR